MSEKTPDFSRPDFLGLTEGERRPTLKELKALYGGSVEFRYGAATLDRIPDTRLPEIALAGRSNVGKSSLINAVLMGRDMAHVSKTPGRTQQLNFFDVGGKFHLVDMPGYGYAKVSKAMRSDWDQLIFAYLQGRPNLQSVLVLIDSRQGMKDSDDMMMDMLDDAAVSYRVILTKADEVKKDKQEKILQAVREKLAGHTAAYPEPLMVSAHGNEGLDDLRTLITVLSGRR